MRNVVYKSFSRKDCDCASTVSVCVDAALTADQTGIIDATFINRTCVLGPCGETLYAYQLEYDEALLADPTYILGSYDIEGFICHDCLTKYISVFGGGGGAPGPQGPVGPQGPIGPQGPQGDRGGLVYSESSPLWVNGTDLVVTHPADPDNERYARAVVYGRADMPGGGPGFLLHFNGNYNDELGHVFVPGSQTSISAMSPKFGNGCLYFNYTNSAALDNTSDELEFAPGAGDFTVDFWIRRATNIEVDLFYLTDTHGADLAIFTDHPGDWSGTISLFVAGSKVLQRDISAFTGSWMHFAVTRQSGVIYTFVNGIADGGMALPQVIGGQVHIGDVRNSLTGLYMDEIRYLKGVCMWTTDFVPPVVPYTTGIYPITPLPVAVGNNGIATDRSNITAMFNSSTQTTFTNRTGLSIAGKAIVQL